MMVTCGYILILEKPDLEERFTDCSVTLALLAFHLEKPQAYESIPLTVWLFSQLQSIINNFNVRQNSIICLSAKRPSIL